ncbi:DUF4158 domain-containing protein, partial [Escherichia coli]|uniref:DUF4158 domain-containing protein n=1 Tax=Escherichia coli TaxID=562 RepID=UPI003B3AC0BE
MAIAKSERLTVLSDAEQEALYGLPDFDDAQRLEYLALTENELALASSRPSIHAQVGTVAKLAMRQPFVLFKGLTFQKLCLPGAFRPGDHHNKMLRPG